MKDLVQNAIHDNQRFDVIVLLEFLICQCSNNTWKREQGFMKDFVQNVIHDNKRFDDISFLEFVNSQFEIILETGNSISWKILHKMWDVITNE